MDVRKYEQELKKELSNWIAVGQRQKVTIVKRSAFLSLCTGVIQL